MSLCAGAQPDACALNINFEEAFVPVRTELSVRCRLSDASMTILDPISGNQVTINTSGKPGRIHVLS